MNAPSFLLSKDVVTIQRRGSTLDSEGNSEAALTTIYSGRATFFALSGRDLADAGMRKTLIDAGLALRAGIDVQADDVVTTPEGVGFVVVSIETRRLYQRALIRKVS